MSEKIVLEPAAKDFSEANAPHPRIYELKPAEGRALLEKVQYSPVKKYNVDIKDTLVDTGK